MTGPSLVCVIQDRSPARTVELQVALDGARVVLTRKTLNRTDPMDLPGVKQLEVPLAAVDALIRALERVRR
jgi:hypothetical protein